jgi:hypothetical protein
MSNTYFVEILNHHGDVQTRHRFSELPIRIGRAYHNDIILDDAHTAAEHAVIEANAAGTLMLRDLGSHNGIYHLNKRLTLCSLNSDYVYRLGQTLVRVRRLDYLVAAESVTPLSKRWEGWPLALLGLVIISALSFSNTWLADVEGSKSTTYIMSLFSWLGIAAVWSGIWALANRVFGGSAHFNRHLLILAVSLAALYLWNYVGVIFAYGFSWEFITRYGSHLEFALLASMLYFHLRQITPRRHIRLKIICGTLALISSVLMLMKNHQSTNQYADELYMHEMLPPAMRLSKNHDLNDFNQAMGALQIAIDEERKKALDEKNNRDQ